MEEHSAVFSARGEKKHEICITDLTFFSSRRASLSLHAAGYATHARQHFWAAKLIKSQFLIELQRRQHRLYATCHSVPLLEEFSRVHSLTLSLSLSLCSSLPVQPASRAAPTCHQPGSSFMLSWDCESMTWWNF